MKPLILDCHAQLPLWRRLGRGAVNALGWALLAYMWLPLLGFLRQDMEFDAEPEPAPCSDDAVQPLFETLYSHLFIVAGGGGVFLAWSLLQWYEKQRRASTKPRLVTTRQLAQSIRLSEDGLDAWQRTQRIVVYHDEKSGWIRSASCADGLLPVDNPNHGQRKRFIILFRNNELSYQAEASMVSVDGGERALPANLSPAPIYHSSHRWRPTIGAGRLSRIFD